MKVFLIVAGLILIVLALLIGFAYFHMWAGKFTVVDGMVKCVRPRWFAVSIFVTVMGIVQLFGLFLSGPLERILK